MTVTAGSPSGPVLAIDTATSRVVVTLGRRDGTSLGEAWRAAGHRHGEALVPLIEEVLEAAGFGRRALSAIVVGTGPGAFTGLRVGLSTAKGLAIGLGIELAAVPTWRALLAAAPPGSARVIQPAGPQSRLVVEDGRTAVLGPNDDVPMPGRDGLVAVDLAGRAPDDAIDRGAIALDGLGRALLRLGVERLARGGDDPAIVVPDYVSLPRGVARESGEVAWSRDPR